MRNPERCGIIRETSLLNLPLLLLIISGPKQYCYPILTKTMFIKNTLRIHILWIIPFINLPTSLFGALKIRVINLWVSQEFPQRLPVDCSAGVYLLAVPMSLQFKTLWQFVTCFAYHLTLVSLASWSIANSVLVDQPFVPDLKEHIWGNCDQTSLQCHFLFFFFFFGDRLMKKIQCQVRSQLEWDTACTYRSWSKREPCLWRWKRASAAPRQK